jgi:drug/metabolite transporter superfamily protein YnfA
MDDFPTKIADFLEETARKIRAITVDRVRNAAKWTALGMVIAVLGAMATLFVFIAVFRLLGETIGYRTTYAAIGGLFVLLGAFFWSRRVPKTTVESDNAE